MRESPEPLRGGHPLDLYDKCENTRSPGQVLRPRRLPHDHESGSHQNQEILSTTMAIRTNGQTHEGAFMGVPPTARCPSVRRLRFAACVVMLHALSSTVAGQTRISWSTDATTYRGRTNQTFPLVCPPGGRPATVWGSGTYTDDSSICSAGVHAGLITFEEGGTIVLTPRGGRDSYSGSTRNGVTSEDYGEWEGSFVLEAAPAPPPPPPPPPETAPTIAVIPWDRDATMLAPNGRRFEFACPARGTAATVKGIDLYSWDSSICTAAVHAGAITLARGGRVTIEMRPGLWEYEGVMQNGITSVAGTHTVLGFVVVRRQ